MTESVKVTQADWDAAATFMDEHGWLCERVWRALLPGDQEVIAKDFARHRTAAQPEREAVLEEAAQIVFEEVGNHTVCSRVMRRIRALKTTPAPAVKWGPKFAHLADKVEAIIDADAPAVSRDEIVAVLRGAIGTLEQDYVAGCESGDSDWEGLAYQRLEAARAILARLGEANPEGDSE